MPIIFFVAITATVAYTNVGQFVLQ